MARPRDKYGRNIGRPKSASENDRFVRQAQVPGASFDVYKTASGGKVYDPITREFTALAKKASPRYKGADYSKAKGPTVSSKDGYRTPQNSRTSLPKKENLGQAGRPVSADDRRRQMLFDYGIDIAQVKEKLKGGRR